MKILFKLANLPRDGDDTDVVVLTGIAVVAGDALEAIDDENTLEPIEMAAVVVGVVVTVVVVTTENTTNTTYGSDNTAASSYHCSWECLSWQLQCDSFGQHSTHSVR